MFVLCCAVLCPQTKEIAALLSSMGEDEEMGHGHGCSHTHGRGGARKARAAPLTSHTLEAIQDTIGELFAKVGVGSAGGWAVGVLVGGGREEGLGLRV